MPSIRRNRGASSVAACVLGVIVTLPAEAAWRENTRRRHLLPSPQRFFHW